MFLENHNNYLIIKEVNQIKEQNKNLKKINYGLSILKSILAFSVVSVHNFNPRTTNSKIILIITKNTNIHVPSFFIMSFCFISKKLLSLSIKFLVNRLSRLLIPYILWPIIIYTINHILNSKYHINLPESYNMLKLQLLWASQYMRQFWFQWDLIVITLLFFVIIFIYRKRTIIFLIFLLTLSYFFQYSGFYIKYVFLKLPRYNRFTITRIFEMIPFGVTGFVISYYDILNIFKAKSTKVIIISLLISIAVRYYNIFPKIKGLTYYGIPLNITSSCIIFIFSLFPIDKIKNNFLLKLIVHLTNYTSGVYYLHITIRQYFRYFIYSINKATFKGIIINYLICYFICFFGFLIFSKTPLKYLFS